MGWLFQSGGMSCIVRFAIMMKFPLQTCVQDDLHVQDVLIQRVTRPKLSRAKDSRLSRNKD